MIHKLREKKYTFEKGRKKTFSPEISVMINFFLLPILFCKILYLLLSPTHLPHSRVLYSVHIAQKWKIEIEP